MLTKAETAGLMRAVAEFVRDQIKSVTGPLADRLAAVEARQPEKGDRGEPGERGQDGRAGERGPAGEPGLPGERGMQGERGEPGERGPEGAEGRQGPPGERGDPGERGLDGRDGAPGERGEKGEPGELGPEGPPGKLPIVRGWADEVHYEGEVVAFDGATYQAKRDTGKAPPHDDWTLIAAAGRNGDDGRGFALRSTWDAEETYQALDVVALNGASFAARYDDPGPCPGEGWQLIAMQGKRGKPGEQGPRGEKGDRGPAGMPVVALAIDDDGLLTLTNGDGSTVTLDLYPVLSKIGG